MAKEHQQNNKSSRMNAKYRIQYKYSININKTQFKMPHEAKMIQYHIQHCSHKYDIYSILETCQMKTVAVFFIHVNEFNETNTCKALAT